jgi:hypothetical protein
MGFSKSTIREDRICYRGRHFRSVQKSNIVRPLVRLLDKASSEIYLTFHNDDYSTLRKRAVTKVTFTNYFLLFGKIKF